MVASCLFLWLLVGASAELLQKTAGAVSGKPDLSLSSEAGDPDEEREVTFVFGRFNPPTVGHLKVFAELERVARGGEYRIYTSQSNDAKKNPLSYAKKIKFLRAMFPQYAEHVVEDPSIKSAFDILYAIHEEGFKKVNMVVGEDRFENFKQNLNQYNGVEGKKGFYGFAGGVNVVSAGERDPDADDVSGMSASKLRAAAKAGDFETFSQGMPVGYDFDELLNAVRVGMGVEPVERPHSAQASLAPGGRVYNLRDREEVHAHS